MTRYLLICGCLMLAVPALLTGGPTGVGDDAEFIPPRIIEHPPALIPHDLEHRSFDHPIVVCTVQVDPEGNLMDYAVTRASDMLLVEDMEDYIQLCEFAPAIENGQPVAIQVDVVIELNYFDQLGLYSVTGTDHLSRHVDELRSPSVLKVVDPGSLDEPLQMLEPPVAVVAVDENEIPLTGSAVVEGLINHRGELRLLRIIKADEPLIGEAALMTFEGVRFNPPIHKGAPAVVKVRIPFIQ